MSVNNVILHSSIKDSCDRSTIQLSYLWQSAGHLFSHECTLSTYKYEQYATSSGKNGQMARSVSANQSSNLLYLFLKKRRIDQDFGLAGK